MGIELFFQGHRNREFDGLSEKQVLNIFKIETGPKPDNFYAWQYDPQNSVELSLEVTNGKVLSGAVFRPCGDIRLYECLFDLLSLGPYVIFAPDSALISAKESLKNHIPRDMQESFEEISVVQNAESLVESLFGKRI